MRKVKNFNYKLDLKVAVALLFFAINFANADNNFFKTENVKISISLNNEFVSNALSEIELITNFKFFYKNEDIDLERRVTFKAVEEPINSVLFRLFEDIDLTFKIVKERIILKKEIPEKNNKIQIQGKIADATTGAPITYANIEVFGSLIGTSSNELGEFILEVDSLPATIVFSHLNYEKKTIEISQFSTINVLLTPLVNNLNEVMLSSGKRDDYAFELAEKALSTMRKLSDKKKYGRAFYRQKSKNGDEYSEFSEIIYDAIYTSEGIEKWEIIEGRYALKPEMVNNSNFTLLSRILKSIQPETDYLIFPLRFNVRNFYDIKIIDMLSSADGDLATLWFKPLENVIAPILDAEVVINTKTYDVLKVSGTVVNDHLEFIKFKEKNTFIKNYQLSYEMVFKKTSNQELLIDYIKIDHSFDYYRDDAFLTHVISTSDLTFFEQYKPDNSRRIRNKFWRKSDWEALNKIGYNEAFWRNNPIVKRTPVEEEVITSFEKDNAFESIFLNTKEQISFMQSNLRGDLFIENFDGLLRKYNNYNPVEKVFLHTDKNVFVAGETVWYKAYVVLGEYHQFSLGSKVLHVDLIDSNNKIILSQTHKIVEGHAQGYLELPRNLQTGDYQLRAYTNWMRNFDQDFFFTKNIKLLNKDNDKIEKSNSQEAIDLQFFPEGGYAVSGISGKITFKAIGSDGLGRDVKGQIKNSKGKTVLSINSMYKGMGFFSLKPEANETYTAILDDGLKFDLPQIQDKGYVMVVDNLNTRNIKVKVQASNELRNKPFYIIGTMNNNKQYQGRFKFNTESVIDFEIPKSKLASGVLTLTLFDEQMRPWCERAIFINNKNELTIEAGLSKSDFNKRGKFELKVHIKDSYGAPLSTKFSVAVTDADKVEKDNKDANILTHLLLQSDIKGHVENSGYYFSDDKRSTAAKLDLVMLTHGWRKFNWEELDKIDFNSLKEFPFERGYTISGIATNMQDVPLKNKALKMIGKSKDVLKLYTTTTNNDGSFRIENVDNSGSVELAFNAYNTKDEAINTKVVLVDKNKEKELPVPNFKNHKGGSYNSKAMPFFVYEDAQILDEVLVNAKNKIIEKPKYASSLYHVEPDNTILADNNRNGNILYHIADVSGIDVVFLSNQVVIRGNSYGPLWVIDGMTLREPNADLKVPDYIYGMDMSNVERIEIIKSAYKAAVYGPSGKYGVIAIYTKTGKLKQDNSFTSKHSINGFSKFKEFYSPKYDVDINMSDYSDNRTTLYWNPSVKTDKDGNATIIFYNSDITNSIEVDVQALSEYGAPGAYLSTFKEK